MTEVVEQKGFGARRLVLGFDAGCMTCSELARKIEDEVGEKLEVRPLHDPQVTHWREQALGEDAPWAPTLVEVKGGEVKAWTGLKMGVMLSRRLGPGTTWRVMQLIGEIKAAPSATPNAGLSRGQFIKGLGGTAVAASVLLSGTFSSVALAQNDSSALQSRRLSAGLRRMGPYVELGRDKTITVNIAAAEEAGVKRFAIKAATNMAELNNRIMSNIYEEKMLTTSSPEIEQLNEEFEPLFMEIALGRNQEAYQAQAGNVRTTQARACGGNRNNPHRCPSRRDSRRFFRSARAMRANLLYRGFAETPGWASGYAPYDFTRVVPAYRCNNGPFRIQAYGYRVRRNRYTYWTQSPEPNPVLTRYVWPTWWWGSYVRWWHRDYC